MEPILTKLEISELMTAIKAGKIPLGGESDSSRNRSLAATAINLFEMNHHREEQARIPNFDIILDTFCRNYAISLSNQLQRTFAITRTSMRSEQYQEYIAQRNSPGAIGLVNMPPLQHSALVVLDRNLAFSMIEVMLGASASLDPLQLERGLTTIELNILKTVITEACSNIDKAFDPIIELSSRLFKIENTSRLISIAEPESEVIVGTFQIEVDELSGEIDLVFPVLMLDPLREKLRELLTVNVTTRDSWQDLLEENIREMMVEIVAQSGTIDLAIDQILELRKGDILPLHYNPNSPLKIVVESQQKYLARPGVSNGRKAISITGVY